MKFFETIKAAERPTHVQFANGRTGTIQILLPRPGIQSGTEKRSLEPVPDITPLLKPTALRDIATYTLFAAGDLFFGGELGLLTGSTLAARRISANPEARARIETAFRKFKADALRRQADQLDGGKGSLGTILGT